MLVSPHNALGNAVWIGSGFLPALAGSLCRAWLTTISQQIIQCLVQAFKTTSVAATAAGFRPIFNVLLPALETAKMGAVFRCRCVPISGPTGADRMPMDCKKADPHVGNPGELGTVYEARFETHCRGELVAQKNPLFLHPSGSVSQSLTKGRLRLMEQQSRPQGYTQDSLGTACT